MTAHSKMIGGSSAKRVINCPGSWRLGQTLPEQPSSSYADEGTMLHSAMALILDGQVDYVEDVVGMTHGDEHELSLELFNEMIVPALDLFNSIDWLDVDIEATVSFPDLPGEFGTGDVVGHTDEFTAIVDWKFGRGVYVSPIKNEQLRYYASAARHSRPDWFEKDKPIRLYIVQPGFGISNKPYDEVSLQDLVDFERQLKVTTRTMKKTTAPFKAGDWCKWCPAMPACPVINKIGIAALKSSELKPKELGRWLAEDAPKLEEMISERRALARGQLESGHSVPGMKLVAKKLGNRKWADEDEIAAKLRSFGRKFKVADFYKHTLLGPAPIEKLLKKKDLSLNDLKPHPDDEIITRSSGGTNLVPDDAEGTEVSMSGVFKEIAKRAGK